MEKLFELTFQDQTLNPQVGTFTDASQATGTFTLEAGEYYLTNGDTKGFYVYAPIAIQPDSETDNKVTVEFDLKVVTASVNTHAIIGTYAGVDGSGIPTVAKITLQYNAGDIELVLGSGTTATLIAAADVVVDQWYHFRIDCALDAPTESTYQVKIDGTAVTTVTGATTDYALGVISVLGTDMHSCDECGIKNIRLITDDDYFVGRTALNQALTDTKGYVDAHLTVDSALSSSSENPVQNKVVKNALDSKLDVTDVFATWNYANGNLEIPNVFSNTVDSSLSNSSENPVQNKVINAALAGYVPRSGGAVMTGTYLGRIDDTGQLVLFGGDAPSYGAYLALRGQNYNNGEGTFNLCARTSSSSERMFIGFPNGTLQWFGQPIQYASDQRYKQQIAEIDDKLLDAWEDVDLVQFKYNDAVDAKKDKARLHTGYVVQQIDKACKEHGVDISAYGLFCHEEYPEETEEVEVEQADGTKTKETKVIREASEHYSLRYTEALIVECAYLRKKNKELQGQLDKVISRLDKLEKGE